MSGPTPTLRPHCRACGYDLVAATAPVCPECGRGFDLADPRTFDPSARSRVVRRWQRRALVAIVLIAGFIVLAPRGHVTSSVTMTCPTCGLDRTVEGTRPIAASWLPWRYPMFTRTTERTPSTAPPPGCTHGVTFSFAVSKRRYTLFGIRAAGGLTVSSGPTRGGTGSVNEQPVTGGSAAEVMRSLSRAAASGNEFGVRVNNANAGGGSSATTSTSPAVRRRRGSVTTDMDLQTSPNPHR